MLHIEIRKVYIRLGAVLKALDWNRIILQRPGKTFHIPLPMSLVLGLNHLACFWE